MRKTMRLCMAGLLGAAVVILPARAVSETTPTVDAENAGAYTHYWTPAHVQVEPDGAVQFANPTGVPHGIEWVSTPGGAKPECSAGVPVGTTAGASGEHWSGTCTFKTPGVYTLYCTVHGAAMSATVTVGPTGTTTTTTTGTTTGTTTATGTTAPATTTTGGGSPAPVVTGTAGRLVSALRLRPSQHGPTLRGSVTLGRAAAGKVVEVELLAARGALAAATGPAAVPVATVVRPDASAGVLAFALHLDRRAARVLRARGRLTLTLRVLIGVPGRAKPTLSRSVTLLR
jgi:plastocyanin